MATTWSSYQTAIFEDVANGDGHTVVQARAGSGKTTTIVESMRHLPSMSPALMVAFNKSIATELKRRAPADVEVKTLHSHGFAAVRRAYRGVGLSDDRTEKLFAGIVGGETNPRFRPSRGAICKTVSLAKNTNVSGDDELDDLIDGFDIDVPDCFTRPQFLVAVQEVLQASRTVRGEIDFDDMVWLPIVNNLPVDTYGHVFIDETQDLNGAQLELALRSVMAMGRITAIGDDRQAIYGFRGAGGKGSMTRIIDGLGAKVLPLSVTYRCPIEVVNLAKKVVPDLEAAPGAKQGAVVESDWSALRKQVKPGDFVISRFNAPLVSELLQFVQEGRRACMLGRDYLKTLTSLITKSKASDVESLRSWIDDWLAREIERISKKGADPSAVIDRANALRALCEGVKSTQEVLGRIDTYFAAEPDGQSVVFTSTHKAKGLEADRVFLFGDTYRRFSEAAEQATALESGGSVTANARRSIVEERNLWYVAVTRCANELFIAGGVK